MPRSRKRPEVPRFQFKHLSISQRCLIIAEREVQRARLFQASA
jgi:hypothetical protein